MQVCIEKLSVSNNKQENMECSEKKTAELTALNLARSVSFGSDIVEMGDIINIGNDKFLVEADQSVTFIEQDEYAYYKGIDSSERRSRWFAGALN